MNDKKLLDLYGKAILWLEKKYKAKHMEIYKNDLKCPNCQEWMSISGLKGNHLSLDHVTVDGVEGIKCGQCGHNSYWNYSIAPVAIRCDFNGTPIPPVYAPS